MLFTAVDHPSIACHDVERQIAWYCENLGMRVIASNAAKPPSVIVGYGPDARGGAVLELMPVGDPGPEPASLARYAPGLRHVALRVSDFEAAYRRLKELGVTFLFEPASNAVGGGKIVSFRDPEGNELQIVQR
jgi:glyoxylase I family protein